MVVVFYLLKPPARGPAGFEHSAVAAINETQPTPRFKILHNWLLIIQLILLALAVFALTRPYFAGKMESGRFLLVAMDVSASTQSTDVSPNRLPSKGEIAKLIDGMFDNDEMVLILSGVTESVSRQPVPSRCWHAALRQAQATDSTTRLDAIKLAQNLTRNRSKAEVHLFSDGSIPTSTLRVAGPELVYHRIEKAGTTLALCCLKCDRTRSRRISRRFLPPSGNADECVGQ